MRARFEGAPTAGGAAPERAVDLLALAALLAALAFAAPSPSEAHAARSATDTAAETAAETDSHRNAAYGLRESTVQTLAPVLAPDGTVNVIVTLDGIPRRLDLAPHSVRAEHFVVLAHGRGTAPHDDGPGGTGAPNGTLRPVVPDPPRTLRGTVAGAPGAHVAASMLDDGLHATVQFPNGDRHWVQPLHPVSPEARPGVSIVYRGSDVLAGAATCAAPDKVLVDRQKAFAGTPPGPPGPGDPCVADLACDADHEYFQLFGSVSATLARIESIVNTVNAQYEAQVGLTHEISAVIVRSDPADPYTAPDSNTLLCQFISEWSSAQADVQRDLAIMFTGRNLTGPVVGQAADIGDICNSQGCCGCGEHGTDGSYCLVQAEFDGALACASDLVAHELGHLWGASHCTCPGGTMNSIIPCANAFTPASIADILAYLSTVPCMDGCGGGNGPPNDTCDTAIETGDGTTPFSTLGATTDGPDEPALCANAGDTTVASDVWFSYLAPCSGTATVDLCGSAYDTRIAVYDACPDGPDQAIACNDDFDCNGNGDVADDGFVSRVEFTAIIGAEYLLRVGGYMGATGTGVMSISCTGASGADDDFCDGAKLIPANALLALDNTDATPGPQNGAPGDADLPAESPSCQWNGTPDEVHSTLWYAFVATHDTIAIETCAGSGAPDTILALYDGTCGSLTEIACGEDDCGPSGLLSRVCASGLVPGTMYRVMVGNPGSWAGSEPGPISLGLTSPCPDLGGCCLEGPVCTSIDAQACAAVNGVYLGDGTSCSSSSCPGGPTCPEDLNGDDSVGFSDLNELLSAWGDCPACPEDLSGDGSVGFGDLNQLLSAWGACGS